MFIKYPHIERLGTDEVEGITVGECHIFPKIDGTNASVWTDGSRLLAGSRNQELSDELDNAGFYKYVLDSAITARLTVFLNGFANRTLYGEWLVPHSLKTYREDAWRKFYIFDMYDRKEELFIPYAEYVDILEGCGLDYIPPIETATNPSPDHLHKVLMQNTYLIKDGEGAGEGIVIKRYDYKNRYGRTTWAKLVRSEFKERKRVPKVARDTATEIKIINEYITQGRIDKIVAKMKAESDDPLRTRVPELFGRTWHELIQDELWSIVRKRKPVIDFKSLYRCMVEQIKVCVPEVFG